MHEDEPELVPRVIDKETAAYVVLATMLFGYVLARAALVPLVHDEATSFLAYAQSGHFLPFASMWDANNHYLSSLLGHIGYKLFGLHLLALRWGSVAAYVLFAWSAWRIGEHVRTRMVRWCLWLALLSCPFLLDFFSLFRGYGPAMAFLLFSLQALLRYVHERRSRGLVLVLLSTAIANGFVLALVPLWAAILLLVLWHCGMNRRQLWLWVFLGALPFLGATGLAALLARFGLLYHGSIEGFLEVTVRSLALNVLGTSAWPVTIGCALLVVGAVLVVLPRAWHERVLSSPGFVMAVLLFGEVCLRLLLANVFGINYAEDRAALHTLILGLLLLAFAGDALAEKQRAWQMLAALLLLLPARTLIYFNLDHTVLWPEQAIPDRFVHRVEVIERELGRPAIVGAYRLSGLTWSLQRRMLAGEGDVNAIGWPNGAHDVRIVDHRFRKEDMTGYVLADSVPSTGLRFWEKEPRLATHVVTATNYFFATDSATRNVVFTSEAMALRERDVLLEDARWILASSQDPLDVRLCVGVFDTLGQAVHNDFVFLSTRRATWHGEAFRTIRLVPQRIDAARMEVWFWNPEQAPMNVDRGRVLMRSVEP